MQYYDAAAANCWQLAVSGSVQAAGVPRPRARAVRRIPRPCAVPFRCAVGAGAKGDGITDDAPAIQRAIDEAQQVSSLGTATGPSRPVYFPAGAYLLKSSLNVVSTHVKESNQQLALSLRLYGDGVGQSVLVAAVPMDAVLRFAGHGPNGGAAGVTTNGHTVENIKFDAAGLANYSVAATAITRSLFRYSDFSGARIAGLFLGCENAAPPSLAAGSARHAPRPCKGVPRAGPNDSAWLSSPDRCVGGDLTPSCGRRLDQRRARVLLQRQPHRPVPRQRRQLRQRARRQLRGQLCVRSQPWLQASDPSIAKARVLVTSSIICSAFMTASGMRRVRSW